MKNISTALVFAQRAYGKAIKNAKNPHLKSMYADLSSCLAAVTHSLNESGIALVQRTQPTENGIVMETVFVHESGEQLSCGQLFVPVVKNDAQGFGSALTYARRYSLMTACGLAAEDDDGNAASAPTPEKTKPVLSPTNRAQWANAKAAFLRDGNLDAVKAKCEVSAGVEAALLAEHQK